MQDSTVTITITAVDGATKVFQGVGDTAVKQANRAAAAWQKANSVQNVSIESTGKLGKAAGNAANQQERLAASTRRSYLAQTALTTVLSASVNQAFLQMIDVTGQAIQRVDLLANFPKSMEALGLSAADASESLKVLSQYIGQIGGNLQEATTSVARFAEVTKNVKAATAIFVGLNNALIAGGAGEQVRASGLEQFTQAFSRGVPQLIEWRSLMVAMPAQLNAVAEAMKFKNAQQLGESLTQGKTSMKDFVVELTKLSTGTGPIAQQALARMSGIQFAWNVFKNTLVEGMTAIIQTIGRQNIVDFFVLLTGVVRQLAVWAVQLISILFSLFNIISRVFGGPQLKLAKDNTAGIADNLGAGSAGAKDLADGLDDASKAAKKTANQLASFDKMNVLTESSGSDKDKSKSGAPLSAADVSGLEDIFGNIDGKIADVTGSAKILAGILASLAGIKLAQGLLNQFNGLAKTLEDTSKNIDTVAKKFDKLNEKMLGVKGNGKSATETTSSFTEAVKNMSGAISNSLAVVALLFSNSKFGKAGAKFATALFSPVLLAARVIVGVIATALAGVSLVTIGIIIAIIAAVAIIIFLIVKYWDEIWAAIKTAATIFKDWIVGLWQSTVEVVREIWNQLYDIFAAPVKWFLRFFEGVFIVLVAIIATALELVVKLFILLVKAIFEVLSTVATWVYDNVITPLVNFFVALWDKVVELARAAWNFVLTNVLAPVVTWIGVNVITPVFNFFKGLWDGVINLVRGFWTGVMNILSPFATWINDHIIQPILGFFNWLWDRIRDGLSAMISGLGKIFGDLVGIAKAPINGIIDLLNKVLQNLNKTVKVPTWVPGDLGGRSPNFGMIPKLARGGVVEQSTFANVGDNGAEAIVPLENNMEWLDKLASKINSANGNGGQPIQLVIQIGEDKIATKIIDLINEKTQMSGRNAILV